MKKRLFSILTALALCLSLLPTAALAVSMTKPPQANHTIGGSTVYPYELSTAAHLYWFANQINTTQQDLSAVLTADITVNQNVLNASGGLNSGSFEAWTPIGTVEIGSAHV